MGYYFVRFFIKKCTMICRAAAAAAAARREHVTLSMNTIKRNQPKPCKTVDSIQSHLHSYARESVSNMPLYGVPAKRVRRSFLFFSRIPPACTRVSTRRECEMRTECPVHDEVNSDPNSIGKLTRFCARFSPRRRQSRRISRRRYTISCRGRFRRGIRRRARRISGRRSG